MYVRVAKEFDFHAAHVLPHHDGQCSRLHGHTYKLRVAVFGRVRPVDMSPDEGMVIDFKVLKDIYRDRIEPLTEHQNLNETLVAPGIIPVSSCEQMVGWIAREFDRGLAERITRDNPPIALDYVRLWETPTSWAEIEFGPKGAGA